MTQGHGTVEGPDTDDESVSCSRYHFAHDPVYVVTNIGRSARPFRKVLVLSYGSGRERCEKGIEPKI